MKSKHWITVAFIAVAGVLLALLTVGRGEHTDEHGHAGEHREEEVARGPHGGRLLDLSGFELEVTIFETGVEPEFRVYPLQDGDPVSPEKVKLRAEVHRLGNRIDRIAFRPRQDYLVGDAVVYEPHSFRAVFYATYGEVSGQGEYEQVEGRTEMSDESVAASGISIATAGPARIRSVVELPGEVRLNLDRTAHIGARLHGVISAYPAKLGDRVRKGQTLVVLASRELAEAKQEFVESLHHLELSESTFQREETLWKKGITPEEDFLKAKHALEEARINRTAARDKLLALGVSKRVIDSLTLDPERNLARFELQAPFAGTIIEKNFTLGESVSADTDLLVVTDLSTVWVDVNISPEHLRSIRTGQKVLIQSKELGASAEGTLTFIDPVSQGETRIAKGRVVLQNPNQRWRPGLYVSVKVIADEVEAPITVRADAIQAFRDWDVVFVRYGDFFEAQPVELGRRDEHNAEVLSGLTAGTPYASKNSFVVKADVLKSGASHDH